MREAVVLDRISDKIVCNALNSVYTIEDHWYDTDIKLINPHIYSSDDE